MVSQDSASNPSSNVLLPFIISNSMAGQHQYENQYFDAYGCSLRGNNTFHQSHGILTSVQSLGDRMSRSMDLLPTAVVAEESEISGANHLMDLLGTANENQRLSLSLGSRVLVSSVPHKQRFLNLDAVSSSYLVSAEEDKELLDPGEEQTRSFYPLAGSSFPSSSTSFNRPYLSTEGTEYLSVVISNSRYLRPTQSLLEEVLNLGSRDVEESLQKLLLRSRIRGSGVSSELRAELCGNENLVPEKYELQTRIAKLITLLEEVEFSYEKYCRQLEEVVSSFETLTGPGAARSYTALALQAMSRHFVSLRDAIIFQINAMRRKLLNDLPKINMGLSKLSLFDRETTHRSPLSLQQLGLIQRQRQTWRPIRGLPETSVAILRSWLFEHFLHPYPNDSEKLMLASQTGLTKNQVSNWFINARVRLWKPMIEEMYREEFEKCAENSTTLLANNSTAREVDTDQDGD